MQNIEKNKNTPTDEQQKAIETISGIVCLSAGPGCGKTFVLVNRYFKIVETLLKNGVKIEKALQKILAVTFTNKATAEMKQRISKFLENFDIEGKKLEFSEVERLKNNVNISTIDSWATSFLRDSVLETNLDLRPDFEMISEVSAKMYFLNFAKKFFDSYDEKKLSHLELHKNPIELFKEIYQFIQSLKSRLIIPEKFWEITQKSEANDEIILSLAEFIKDLYADFNGWMLERNYLVFADLLFYVNQIFVTNSAVLKNYAKNIDYILVDEYQDINDAQDYILRFLSQACKKTQHENYFLVGDIGQSIYGFRNANYKNMLEYKNSKSDHSLNLSKNFRSTKNIVDFTNLYFAKNSETKIYQNLEAESSEIGEKVSIILADSKDDEAAKIALNIQNLITKNECEFSDIKILLKKMSDVWKYALALEKRNIPFIILGGSDFQSRPEIRFFMSIFKILANPNDEKAHFIVMTHPIFNFKNFELAILKSLISEKYVTIFETLKLNLEAETDKIDENFKQKIKFYIDFVEKFIDENFDKNIMQIFKNLQIDPNFKNFLDSLEKIEYLQTIDSIKKFKILVDQYEKERYFFNISDFLKYYEACQEEGFSVFTDGNNVNEYKSVVLMTIHSSKGLEFPVVFLSGFTAPSNKSRSLHFDEKKGLIVNVDAKKLKAQNRIDFYGEILKEKLKQEAREEEERVFYVGATRAKKMLFISNSLAYKKFNEFIYKIVDVDEKKIKPEFENFVKLDNANLKESKIFTISKLETKVENFNCSKNIANRLEKNSFKQKISKFFYSVSELETYQKSPREYFLKYQKNLDFELEFPVDTESLERYKKNISEFQNMQIFGNIVHKFLEKFFDNSQKNSIVFENSKNIKDFFIKKFRLENFEIDEFYRDKIEKFLDWFLAYKKQNLKILGVEKNFNWNIGTAFVRGKIDRIDEIAPNTIRLIDYKTGEKIRDKDYEFSMNVYALACEEIWGYEVCEMKIIYPFANKEIAVTKSDKNLIKNKIIETIGGIERMVFASLVVEA